MKKLFFICLTIFALSSCSTVPRVDVAVLKSYPQDLTSNVEILSESPDSSYEMIGSVYVGEPYLMVEKKCNYKVVLEMAVEEARKVGANALLIKEHHTPTLGFLGFGANPCHRIRADLFRKK